MLLAEKLFAGRSLPTSVLTRYRLKLQDFIIYNTGRHLVVIIEQIKHSLIIKQKRLT